MKLSIMRELQTFMESAVDKFLRTWYEGPLQRQNSVSSATEENPTIKKFVFEEQNNNSSL